MGPSSAVSKVVGDGAREDQHRLRAMAARTVTDSLSAAVARFGAAEKAARLEECARSLEAEKAKMEVFRRELPISVHLIADGTRARPSVRSRARQHYSRSCASFLLISIWLSLFTFVSGAVIQWLKDEVAQHRTAAPSQLLAPLASRPPAKRKAEGVKTEADATDKRSWMSSAQLWTCGSHSSASTSNGGSHRKQAQKVEIGVKCKLLPAHRSRSSTERRSR
jgi:hypothetical protein